MTPRLLLLLSVIASVVACGGGGGVDTPSATPFPVRTTTLVDPPIGSWRAVAPLPTPRTEVAAATFDGLVYAIGGIDSNGSVSAKVEVYDPKTDTWSEAPPLPTALHSAAAVSSQPILYVVGGFAGPSLKAVATLYGYDSASKTWSRYPDMPTPRGALGADSLGGLVYAVGGLGGPAAQTALESYDPATGEWSVRPRMPTGRDHLGVVAANNVLHAIGGRVEGDKARNLATNEHFDPRLNAWNTHVKELPTPRSKIAATATYGWVGVFGGEEPGGTSAVGEVYDIVTDTWMPLAAMPTPRHGAAAVGLSLVSVIVIGGTDATGSVTGNSEVFACC